MGDEVKWAQPTWCTGRYGQWVSRECPSCGSWDKGEGYRRRSGWFPWNEGSKEEATWGMWFATMPTRRLEHWNWGTGGRVKIAYMIPWSVWSVNFQGVHLMVFQYWISHVPLTQILLCLDLYRPLLYYKMKLLTHLEVLFLSAFMRHRLTENFCFSGWVG